MLINRKHSKLVFAFFMSLIMSFVMLLVTSISNVGLTSDIVGHWLSAFVFSLIVAFPTAILASPVVAKLARFVSSD